MRTRRSILNYATTIAFTVIVMATSLVATPLLLRWLGQERFGAYRMIYDSYGYLTLLDLGLGGALAPLLARAIGRGDRRGLRNVMAAGMRLYLGVALAALVVGLAATPVIVHLVMAPGTPRWGPAWPRWASA